MGRPPKLNSAVSEAILQKVRVGIPETTAARAAGVALSTFNLWKQKGREGQQPYATFVDGLMCARAQGEASLVATIIQAARSDAPGDWRAAAWLLGHAGDWRQRWGQPEAIRTAVDAAIAQVVKVLEVEVADVEQRHRLLLALTAAGVGRVATGEEDDAEA